MATFCRIHLNSVCQTEPLSNFSDKSWLRVVESAARWRELNSELGHEIVRSWGDGENVYNFHPTYGYHRKCYQRFTNSGILRKAEARKLRRERMAEATEEQIVRAASTSGMVITPNSSILGPILASAGQANEHNLQQQSQQICDARIADGPAVCGNVHEANRFYLQLDCHNDGGDDNQASFADMDVSVATDCKVENQTSSQGTGNEHPPCQLAIDCSVYDRWCSVGKAEHLSTDTQIAAFLLNQYDNSKTGIQSSAPFTFCCPQCGFLQTSVTPIPSVANEVKVPNGNIPSALTVKLVQNDTSAYTSELINVETQTCADCSLLVWGHKPSFASKEKSENDSSEKLPESSDLPTSAADNDDDGNDAGDNDAGDAYDDDSSLIFQEPPASDAVTGQRCVSKSPQPSHNHINPIVNASTSTVKSIDAYMHTRVKPKSKHYLRSKKSHSQETSDISESKINKTPDLNQLASDDLSTESAGPQINKKQIPVAISIKNIRLPGKYGSHVVRRSRRSGPSQPEEDKDWAPEGSDSIDIEENIDESVVQMRDCRQKKLKGQNYGCEVCFEVFDSCVALRKHIVTHDGVKTFCCNLCDSDFDNKDSFAEHRKKHKGGMRLKCFKRHCSWRFESEATRKKHMLTHTPPPAFKSCPHCEKLFPKNRYLREHMRTHTGEKPYVCETCGCIYRHKSSLQEHMLKRHDGSEEQNFVCDVCGDMLQGKSKLNDHMKEHPKPKPHKCNICHARFSCEKNLSVHVQRHVLKKVKIHSCEHCGKGFLSPNKLGIHVRHHTGEKPFVCKHCSAAFASVSQMNLHVMRRHLHIKRFECDFCSHTAFDRGSLISHRRTHTREKPFKCGLCPAAFARRDYLKKHNVTHTRDAPVNSRLPAATGTASSASGRRHTGVKCSECGSVFQSSARLAQHMETHTASAVTTQCTLAVEQPHHSTSAVVTESSDAGAIAEPQHSLVILVTDSLD